MQLTPSYGEHPILVAEPLLADPGTPLLRQRARLAEVLAGLDADGWAMPSRCEGWSVQDVIAHLITANQFWAFSFGAGLGGEPSTFLSTFDPVATPADLVAAVRSTPAEETLRQFVETNEAIAAVVEQVDGRWSLLAEAPPGHLAMGLVAQHALWDSWIHERDVMVPLGLVQEVEADEVDACLRYAAALSPTFDRTAGSGRAGAIEVRVTDPDLRVVVEVGPRVVVHDGLAPDGAVLVTGDAVAVLEALSFRGPFPEPLAETDRWVVAGLAEVFDTVA